MIALAAPFVENGIALGLAQFLQDDLLRRLRRDPAEIIVRFERKRDLVVELRILFYLFRFLERDMPFRIEAGKLLLVVFVS